MYRYAPFIFNNECYKLLTPNEIPDIEPNRYWVSNKGCLVYDAKNGRYSSCYYTGNGYISVSLNTLHGHKQFLLHRLVGMLFIDGDFSLQINHKDGKKYNCCDENLEWTTPRENLIHAIEMGLNYRGEDKPNAILTNEQATIICQCLMNRVRVSDILKLIGLEDTPQNRRLVADVKRRRTFAFISKNYDFDADTLCERTLDNDTVIKICKLFQTNPNISYPEIYDIVGLNASNQLERRKLLGIIGDIKLRRSYTDISKHYVW